VNCEQKLLSQTLTVANILLTNTCQILVRAKRLLTIGRLVCNKLYAKHKNLPLHVTICNNLITMSSQRSFHLGKATEAMTNFKLWHWPWDGQIECATYLQWQKL